MLFQIIKKTVELAVPTPSPDFCSLSENVKHLDTKITTWKTDGCFIFGNVLASSVWYWSPYLYWLWMLKDWGGGGRTQDWGRVHPKIYKSTPLVIMNTEKQILWSPCLMSALGGCANATGIMHFNQKSHQKGFGRHYQHGWRWLIFPSSPTLLFLTVREPIIYFLLYGTRQRKLK